DLGVDTVLMREDQRRKPGSCGKPAPGIEIVLFDEDGAKVTGTGPEDPGEVFVRSRSLFETYYKNDAGYGDSVGGGDGGFSTGGNIGYWDEDGYLYICDRKSDLIISGGMNEFYAKSEAVR